MVQVGGFRVVRIAILSYRHFERSREIFLADRWRSMFEARKTQDEGVDEGVVSLQGHVRCQPQCKKDPSATLGMTKGGADGFTRVARCLFRRGDSRIAASPPCGEGAPQGRIGHRRYERGGGGASQVDDYESTLSTAPLSLPRWGRLRGATLRVDFYKGRCPKVVFKLWVTSHNNDTSRPLKTEVPQRDFRIWPNPKRRLACPLRRLPVRPNGPRRRRRIECLGDA